MGFNSGFKGLTSYATLTNAVSWWSSLSGNPGLICSISVDTTGATPYLPYNVEAW